MSGQNPYPGWDGTTRGMGPTGSAADAAVTAALAAGRRGYQDARNFAILTGLEAFDMTLEPFDVMEQKTLEYGAPYATVCHYAMPGGSYGVLRHIGQDCNDVREYQKVSWRVLRNQRGMGGDPSGLLPALEARCGIIDGSLMPFRFFIQPGCLVEIQAALTVGTDGDTAVVRARLQGERRDAYGVIA